MHFTGKVQALNSLVHILQYVVRTSCHFTVDYLIDCVAAVLKSTRFMHTLIDLHTTCVVIESMFCRVFLLLHLHLKGLAINSYLDKVHRIIPGIYCDAVLVSS